MKKIIITALCGLSALVAVSAQVSSSCVDLSTSLSRGMENKNVLALQNFLYAQGYLKATPNGYFGPGTFAAVKALQKSAGLSQVGIAGPATRAYIRTSTCQAGGISQNQPVSVNQPATSTQTASQIATTSSLAPQPQLTSIDLVTVFSGGQTDWGFDLHGSNFSSTTNTVYYKNLGNGMIYTIGTFGSPDGVTITLPQNLGSTKFSCGTSCSQILSPGLYEVSIQTPGGQTVAKTMEIKPFTIKAVTAADTTALPANTTNAKIGTLTFSTSVPVIVKSVSYTVSNSNISSGGVGSAAYTDAMRGNILAQDTELPAFQTMIIDASVNTANTISGTITGFFTVTVRDYIGNKDTTFTSPEFMDTIQGVI